MSLSKALKVIIENGGNKYSGKCNLHGYNIPSLLIEFTNFLKSIL